MVVIKTLYLTPTALACSSDLIRPATIRLDAVRNSGYGRLDRITLEVRILRRGLYIRVTSRSFPITRRLWQSAREPKDLAEIVLSVGGKLGTSNTRYLPHRVECSQATALLFCPR